MPKGNVWIAGLAVTPATKQVGQAFKIDVTLKNNGVFPIDVWLGVYVFDPSGNSLVSIPAWTSKVSLGNTQPTNSITVPQHQAAGWTGPSGDYTVEAVARVWTGAVPEQGELLDRIFNQVILHVTPLSVVIMNIVAS